MSTYKMLRDENQALRQQAAVQAQLTPIIGEQVKVLIDWFATLDEDAPEDVAKAFWFMEGCFLPQVEVLNEEEPNAGSEDLDV